MINIRKANLNDASDYANILNKSWKDTYGEYISYKHIDDEFNIEKLINDFPNYITNEDYSLYIIEDDGKTVGIIEIGKYEDVYKEDMDNIGEIRSFHIKKEYQGKGIGTVAINFAIDELKKSYNTICVWVKKRNSKAIRFYENNGFKKTIYGLEETIDGAPSIVMEKEL